MWALHCKKAVGYASVRNKKEQNAQQHRKTMCSYAASTMARPTCSCMGQGQRREARMRQMDGEANMQLHTNPSKSTCSKRMARLLLARPRKRMARPACRRMVLAKPKHWRGREREWRGRNAVGRHAVAWVIGREVVAWVKEHGSLR